MDLRIAAFPSDALSIKRFRILFPQHFDLPDRIADGYSNSDFFFPRTATEPPHLLRLSGMTGDERTVAVGAFFRALPPHYPVILNEEDLECLAAAKSRLEESYQYFKLADSPEMARLLIRQVEQAGEQQVSDQAKGR